MKEEQEIQNTQEQIETKEIDSSEIETIDSKELLQVENTVEEYKRYIEQELQELEVTKK